MSNLLFSKGKVAKLLDITPRTVSHYTEEGVIIPEQEPGDDRKRRLYSENNLFEFMLVLKLKENNFDLQTIKQILSMLQRGTRVKGPGNEILVIYDGHTEHGTAKLTSTDKNLSYKVTLKNYSSVVVIDISELREKLARILM